MRPGAIEVTAEIADTLSGTALAGADIVPVSTVTGEGIDALRAALFDAAAAARRTDRKRSLSPGR